MFFKCIFFKFETLYTPGNEQLYHHWLMYECDSKIGAYLQTNPPPRPGIYFLIFSYSSTNYFSYYFKGSCYPQFNFNNNYDNTWENVTRFCNKISLG